jgi:putative DNA methylase
MRWEQIRKASVGPVDMPQSVIGPGMGVFTRYARVLEDDDSTMSVKTALALINRVSARELAHDELQVAFYRGEVGASLISTWHNFRMS